MWIPAALAAGGSLLSMFQKNPYQGLIDEQTQMAKLGTDQARAYLPMINEMLAAMANGTLPPQFQALLEKGLADVNSGYRQGANNLQAEAATQGLSSDYINRLMHNYGDVWGKGRQETILGNNMQRWNAMGGALSQLGSNVLQGGNMGTNAAGTAGNLIGAGENQKGGLYDLIAKLGQYYAMKDYQPAMPQVAGKTTLVNNGSFFGGGGSDIGNGFTELPKKF